MKEDVAATDETNEGGVAVMDPPASEKSPWASYMEIHPQAEGKIWVRWCGCDGIYRWLHPVEDVWVEEPNQIDMPNFASYDEARAAAELSPEPPTWQEWLANRPPELEPVPAEPTTDAPADEPVGSRGTPIDLDPLPDLQQWHRIQDARKKVADWQSEVDEAKESMKSAKDGFDSATEFLLKLIDETGQPTLFNTAPSRKPEKQSTLDEVAPVAEPVPENDGWKILPISELGLSKSITAKINDAFPGVDVVTIGMLSEWKNARPHRQYTDIAGITKGAAEKIGVAHDPIWKRFPQGVAPAAEVPAPEDEDEAANDAMRRLMQKVTERCTKLEITADTPEVQAVVGTAMIHAVLPPDKTPHTKVEVDAIIDSADASQIDAWTEQIRTLPDAAFIAETRSSAEADIVAAIDLVDKIEDAIAKVPAGEAAKGEEFFNGVYEGARNVRDAIDQTKFVTIAQRVALEKWKTAVETWQG